MNRSTSRSIYIWIKKEAVNKVSNLIIQHNNSLQNQLCFLVLRGIYNYLWKLFL